jgi:hypothetical protein
MVGRTGHAFPVPGGRSLGIDAPSDAIEFGTALGKADKAKLEKAMHTLSTRPHCTYQR